MPVLFSRACEYALRALCEMAHHPEQEFWTVQELAKQTDAPAPFLAKIFQQLVKGKVLVSSKGRRGGFALARSPKTISLLEIVEHVDGMALANNCTLGLQACNNQEPCPFHGRWVGIREAILHALRHQTIAQAAFPTVSRTGLKKPEAAKK